MTMQATIEQKLNDALTPSHLEVINESYMHNVPEGAESHFKVIIVSEQFNGERLLARHRLVNAALADELSGGIHALSMHTRTPEEWAKENDVPESPLCHGGSKS